MSHHEPDMTLTCSYHLLSEQLLNPRLALSALTTLLETVQTALIPYWQQNTMRAIYLSSVFSGLSFTGFFFKKINADGIKLWRLGETGLPANRWNIFFNNSPVLNFFKPTNKEKGGRARSLRMSNMFPQHVWNPLWQPGFTWQKAEGNFQADTHKDFKILLLEIQCTWLSIWENSKVDLKHTAAAA